MNTKMQKAIVKALDRVNLKELYERATGVLAEVSGFYDDLFPLVFDIAKGNIYFLQSRPEVSENIIFLGSFSANDLLHNDPVSLIREMVTDEDY